jgi:hypothetical protein
LTHAVYAFYSIRNCARSEYGLRWAETCSCRCALTIKHFVSRPFMRNFANKTQRDDPNYIQLHVICNICVLCPFCNNSWLRQNTYYFNSHAGVCSSINLSPEAQSPITWLGHTQHVKIQFGYSYFPILMYLTVLFRGPDVNSNKKFIITGYILLFISIRRLETVQKNFLKIKHKNEEIKTENCIKKQ